MKIFSYDIENMKEEGANMSLKSISGDYALKILMAGINVEDKEALKQGLRELIGSSESIDKDIIVETIVGNPPSNLNTLEKIAIAINNDENFSSTIEKELDSKITQEELEIWVEENLPALSRNEILDICK